MDSPEILFHESGPWTLFLLQSAPGSANHVGKNLKPVACSVQILDPGHHRSLIPCAMAPVIFSLSGATVLLSAEQHAKISVPHRLQYTVQDDSMNNLCRS